MIKLSLDPSLCGECRDCEKFLPNLFDRVNDQNELLICETNEMVNIEAIQAAIDCCVPGSLSVEHVCNY